METGRRSRNGKTEMTYTAERAEEWGIGGGPNGTGRRVKVKGAYTVVAATGRRVRAFTEREGGFDAAMKWAETLNNRQ
jgi:hypothetical protein